LLGLLTPKGFDRLLNSPTNDAWTGPWLRHLTQLGVNLHAAAPVVSINLDGGSVRSVTVEAAGQPAEVAADYYIAAVLVEVMSRSDGCHQNCCSLTGQPR